MSSRIGGEAVAVSAKRVGRPIASSAGRDAEIVGPEVRSPLTHEMRFVDGDEFGLQRREALAHVGVGELLGGEKDEVRAVLGARQLFEGRRRSPAETAEFTATATSWRCADSAVS